jgi:cytosine/adenosine deaminase-related metal-dependent hydrolase
VVGYQARWIVSLDGPPLDGGVVVISDGRIGDVQPMGHAKVDVDLGDVIVLPGLINVHTHLDLTHAGHCRPPLGRPPTAFADWLAQVVAYRRQQTPEQRQQAVRDGLAACLRAGVTVVGDIVTDPQIWSVLNQAPLYGIAWYELIGLTPSRAHSCRLAAEQWLVSPDGTRWQRGLSPHAPYSVHRNLLTAAYQLAHRHRCPITVHLAESAEEEQLLRQHDGPIRTFLQQLGAWHVAGLIASWQHVLHLAPRTVPCLWIHANFLSPQPLSANHTIVHCPRTHAAFGHPPFPLQQWLHCGVRVCLATDSLASNPDLDLLAEARYLYSLHPQLPADQILAMITRHAAAAVGQGDRWGTLSRGKAAHLIVVPLPRGEPSPTDPCQRLLQSPLTVAQVMIDGIWYTL